MYLRLISFFVVLSNVSSEKTGEGFDAMKAYREPLGWHPDWNPKTAAWTEYMDRRMAQISRIENSQQRWDGYLVAMQQGIFVQNYTSKGWAVVECPPEVYGPLLKAFHDKFDDPSKRRFEGTVDQIHCDAPGGGSADSSDDSEPCSGDRRPWMVHTGKNGQILNKLRPLHEEWSGVELTSSVAYGLRVYQAGSSLTMHTDRIETHVISSILHVDRDYAGQEPWPIVIEGIDGVTAEVDLQPGQLLLYESAKCTHGRPRTFKGSWYTSMFIHYRPSDYTLVPKDERTKRVPESWRTVLPPMAEKEEDEEEGTPRLPALTVYGTGFKEHDCAHGWCALRPDWPPAGEAQPEAATGTKAGAFDGKTAHIEL